MTLTIGLTGSIATGKSTVSSMFTNRRIPVIDADIIAREVVRPNEEAYSKIVSTFGKKILHVDGTINRKLLGEIVFSDEAKRKQLNEIVHPAVRKKMIEKRDAYIKKQVPFVVLDIPLLFESKLEHFVDKIIVVYVDEDIQLDRLMKRNGFTEEESLKRIKAQMPVKEKARLADVTINNNGTKQETEAQLDNLLREWSNQK